MGRQIFEEWASLMLPRSGPCYRAHTCMSRKQSRQSAGYILAPRTGYLQEHLPVNLLTTKNEAYRNYSYIRARSRWMRLKHYCNQASDVPCRYASDATILLSAAACCYLHTAVVYCCVPGHGTEILALSAAHRATHLRSSGSSLLPSQDQMHHSGRSLRTQRGRLVIFGVVRKVLHSDR
jgi:hypothetical protein